MLAGKVVISYHFVEYVEVHLDDVAVLGIRFLLADEPR
jgi:hypothetical protein